MQPSNQPIDSSSSYRSSEKGAVAGPFPPHSLSMSISGSAAMWASGFTCIRNIQQNIQCDAVRSEQFENWHFLWAYNWWTTSSEEITAFVRHEYERVGVFTIKMRPLVRKFIASRNCDNSATISIWLHHNVYNVQCSYLYDYLFAKFFFHFSYKISFIESRDYPLNKDKL